jgi:branched-chain amino acid transport system ATP-binding protein
LLEIAGVNTFYGISQALFGVSFRVRKGEAICLLGRNGAGKTTTLKSIIGLTPAQSGSIRFKGEEITSRQPYEIARLGIGYVDPDRRVFPSLTVRENLEVATRGRKDVRNWTINTIYEIFPLLKALDKNKAGYLSGGERQLLVVARSLMGNPELLLLDEPSEGLSPLVVSTLKQHLRKLREEGLTIVLAEMNVRFALELSDRAYILVKGQINHEAEVGEIVSHSEVIEKYLAV